MIQYKRIILISSIVFAALVKDLSAQNIFPASGNAGVGTTAPATLLELKAGHSNTSMRLFSDLYGQGLNGVNTSNLNLWASEPGLTWEGAGIGNNAWVLNTGGTGRVTATRGASFMRLLDNAVEIASINKDGAFRSGLYITDGNVGLGTATPGAALEIKKGHADTRFRLFSDAYGQGTNGVNTATLNFWASEPGLTWEGTGLGNNAFVSGAGGISRVTTTRGGAYMRLLNNAVDISTIDNAGTVRSAMLINNGTVTIGNTPNPAGYRLYVEQGILTEKVKVALKTSANWADHVFAGDYQLTPLNEVETFIKNNQHLPGIPSAQQLVKEGGIDMNMMFAKQMEKIEELTLHLIEMKKEIKQLQQENIRLKITNHQSKK
jgi:hypothetical protein